MNDNQTMVVTNYLLIHLVPSKEDKILEKTCLLKYFILVFGTSIELKSQEIFYMREDTCKNIMEHIVQS